MLGTFWIKFTNAALIFESCTWNKACVYSVGSSVSTSGGLNGKNVFDQCWSGWENVVWGFILMKGKICSLIPNTPAPTALLY